MASIRNALGKTDMYSNKTSGYTKFQVGFLRSMKKLIRSVTSGPFSVSDTRKIKKMSRDIERMSTILEKAEIHYLFRPGRTAFVNEREGQLVGKLLNEVQQDEALLIDRVYPLVESRIEEVQAAACRFLLASSLPSSDHGVISILTYLQEEGPLERLLAWVKAEEGDCQTLSEGKKELENARSKTSLRVYATGLLSVALVDRAVADFVVRSDVPELFLKRLKSQRVEDFLRLKTNTDEEVLAVLKNEIDALSRENQSIPEEIKVRTPSMEELVALECKHLLSCLALMGDYQEILTPFFKEDGLALVMRLLQRPELGCRFHGIEFVSHLLAHKKFAADYVKQGGVSVINQISQEPQAPFLNGVLALCLFGLASLTNVMEEVCRSPADDFERLINYSLSLLTVPHEHTQRHAVLFFSLAFAFRPVISSFDAKGGLYHLLNLVRPTGTTARRENGDRGIQTSGDSPPSSTSVIDITTSVLGTSGGASTGGGGYNSSSGVRGGGRSGSSNKLPLQLAHHTMLALRQYLRVHLAIATSHKHHGSEDPGRQLPSRRRRKRSYSVGTYSTKALEVDDQTALAILAGVHRGQHKLPHKWGPLKNMLHHRGILALLGVVQKLALGSAPRDRLRPGTEAAQFALECLEILALDPRTYQEIFAQELDPTEGNAANHSESHRSGASNQLSLSGPAGRCGMDVLLDAASGQSHRDPELMRAALNVLCVGACPPSTLGLLPHSRELGQTGEKLPNQEDDTSNQKPVRWLVRARNGLKILMNLLKYRRSAHYADEIRVSAACALLGLAQEPGLASVLEKLRLAPLLSEVVRAGPVLEKNAGYHSAFREVAQRLIGRLSGQLLSSVSHSDAMDPAMWRIEKTSIVEKTDIKFKPLELLHLIRDHLSAYGLERSARVLADEAQLLPILSSSLSLPKPHLGTPSGTNSSMVVAHSPTIFSALPPSAIGSAGMRSAKRQKLSRHNTETNHLSSRNGTPIQRAASLDSATMQSGMELVLPSPPSVILKKRKSSSRRKSGERVSGLQTSRRPRLAAQRATARALRTPSLFDKNSSISKEKQTPTPPTTPAQKEISEKCGNHGPANLQVETSTASLSHEARRLSSMFSPRAVPPGRTITIRTPQRVGSPFKLSGAGDLVFPRSSTTLLGSPLKIPGATEPILSRPFTANKERLDLKDTVLDQIVSRYLRHQHEHCPEPISVLPPFSLLESHSCPEKKPQQWGGNNIVAQVVGRQEDCPSHNSLGRRKAMREYIYSRFRPWRCYRDLEGANAIMLSAFLHEPTQMLMGLESGVVQLYNMTTHEPKENFSCHSKEVTCLQVHPEQAAHKFLTGDGRSTALWDLHKPGADALHSFTGLSGTIFDHAGRRLAGILDGAVSIFDASNGSRICKLTKQISRRGVEYKYPSLAFSQLDDLMLADGCLWDPRNQNIVQRFDQLGTWGYGMFHANGYEVVLDGAVWDLRSTKLLRMIPALDQCVAKFSVSGDIIYTYKPPLGDEPIANKRRQDFTSFRVLDSLEYKEIHHHEVDREISHLSVDRYDSYIAVIETSPPDLSVCRLYEIGRQRPNDADSDIDDAHSDSDDGDEDWSADEAANDLIFQAMGSESSNDEEESTHGMRMNSASSTGSEDTNTSGDDLGITIPRFALPYLNDVTLESDEDDD